VDLEPRTLNLHPSTFNARSARNGFTLIESLVALAILGVIVGVLVRVHLHTIRADEFSRLRGKALLESETILTESFLGKESRAILEEAQQGGWKVSAERAGESAYTEWRVAVSNSAAPAVTMMLKAGQPTPEGVKQ